MKSLLLLIACMTAALTVPGAAFAKKSRFTVHNCSDLNLTVKVYNGDDDRPRTFHRTLEEMRKGAGQQKKFTCKVKSGKKRCWVKVEVSKVTYEKRVKDGQTVYVAAKKNPRAAELSTSACPTLE